MRGQRFAMGLVSGLLVLLAACAPAAVSAPGAAPIEGRIIDTNAIIDQARVIEGGQPGAYSIEIHGHFPDGCTELYDVTQTIEGGRIIVTVYSSRDPEAMCTMALVPFSYTLALDAAGLAPGDNVVDVNGVTVPLEPSDEDAAPPAPGPARGDVIVGQASVEQLDVLILESFPVQINVVIEGHLADGCTRVGEISVSVAANRVRIVVNTERPRDAICTMALVPFRETVRLDNRQLTPGTYTVEVHGLTDELRVEAGMLGAP